MRRFVLFRHRDVSGVSGEGVKVWGIVFPDGSVAYRWATSTATTCIADNIETVVAIHGHDGATELVWIDSVKSAERWQQEEQHGRLAG